MKKILLSVFMFCCCLLSAQNNRYLDRVFPNVTTTQNVVYGKNYTVLGLQNPAIGKLFGQPMVADVYQPTGDVATGRPLVIYLHTGNFLPYPQNTGASGTIRDSTCVDFCKKFAQMGYVAASVDYRTGWNPVAPTQDARVNTLINAAYRGVQDVRTAVRFFKANAATFKIDTTKILVFGQGTGGYISLAAASLDKYSEVLTTTNGPGKFIGADQIPYVLERIPLPNGGVYYVNGDIEGKILGLVPPNADGTPRVGPPKTGDTLNFPNHVNNTSSFAMAVNMGGAIGDISWIDQNTVPIVCIQAPYDPFAPYNDAVLNVTIPGGQLPVVRVQGSLAVQRALDSLGKNTAFRNIVPSFDPVGVAIKARQGGYANLFPIIGTSQPNDSSPWDWWDPATNLNHATAIAGNPDMTAAKGRRYIDSVLLFVAPRACIGLNLPCRNLVDRNVSVKELSDFQVGLSIAPNPASNYVIISSNEESNIQDITLFDMTGKVAKKVSNINRNYYELQRESISKGIYFAKIEFKEGSITKKIIFE
jgi:dienelactone hydrolase